MHEHENSLGDMGRGMGTGTWVRGKEARAHP